MIHLAYPNVESVAGEYVFRACVRYLSLSSSQAPPLDYRPASPRTPNLKEIHEAVEELAPGCAESLFHRSAARLYEKADTLDRPWQGSSLDLAYLLALIHCGRSLVFEDVVDVGDVWCTGAIQLKERQPVLGAVDVPGFQAKLEGFFAQTDDRLFLVPKANAHIVQTTSTLLDPRRVLTLAAFTEALKAAPKGSRWPEPTVILVGTFELPKLVATCFQVPTAQAHQQGAPSPRIRPLSRRPYKFLDPFGLADTDLFYGRDHDLAQLQSAFEASRLLLLCGASGTGKTSLLQAGLLPSLPAEQYVWVLVRMVGSDPTAALKEALVHDFEVDCHILEQPLLAGIRKATAMLGKTVVIILDQFEEFFQRHAPAVRQTFRHELRACLDDVRLPVHIVIALREDFLAQLAEFREDGAIPTIFHHIIRLTRFSPAQAYDAVVQPAERLGLPIDATLVEEMLVPQLTDQEEHTIDLPMLQIVCDAWYQQAEEARQQAGEDYELTIGAEAFVQLGDIHTVLKRHLDDTLREFQEPGQAREILKALVSAEEPERAVKRAVFLEELLSRLHTAQVFLTPAELEQRYLHHLVQARLVRATEVGSRTRYELTHDFLVQQIAQWIAQEERELTKILELIDRAYEAYQASSLLLQPEALDLIDPYLDELVLSPEQRAFLDLSRRTEIQKRRRLWSRIGVLLLLVGLGVSGVFGWQLRQSNRRLQETNQELQMTNQQLKKEKDNAETQTKLAVGAQKLAEAQRDRVRETYAAIRQQEERGLLAERRRLEARRTELATEQERVMSQPPSLGGDAKEGAEFLRKRSQEVSRLHMIRSQLEKDEQLLNQQWYQAVARWRQAEVKTHQTTKNSSQTSWPKTLRNSVDMEFVLIPAGEFLRGSTDGDDDERPIHTVRISQSFYLGKYEVTQIQWKALMGQNPSYFPDDPNRPVEGVTWLKVQEFIERLNAREGGADYRLPTEAEWEYAARAGSKTAYSFGDDHNQLNAYAWYANNAHETHAVGGLLPNQRGLYDMHGNVWEWVQDQYSKYPTDTVTDPYGLPWGSLNRVLRGCGWRSSANHCRSASRWDLEPDHVNAQVGFRLVKMSP